MSITDSLDAADNLSKSFAVAATKAAAGGPMSGGGPYGSASVAQSSAFSDSHDLANAAKQYAALRDVPYTAIRPIAVKVASQEIRIGHKETAQKLSRDDRRMRTKSHDYRVAPGFVQKRIAEGMEPEEEHPLLDLFESPNPYMDGWAMRYCTGMSIAATGDAFWYIQRGPKNPQTGEGGLPIGLWYFPKTWVTPIHNPAPFTGYKIKPPNALETGDEPTVHFADMLHFRFPDPSDPLKSFSPLQSQARAVNTDDEIQKAQFALMRNGIYPSVAISVGDLETPNGQRITPTLTPEQRRQIIDTARLYAAGAAHYGDPWIIDGLIKSIDKISHSANDLDFQNGSALTKSRIMQGIGTNPIVAGQIEGANRASSAVAAENFYELVVNPILALMSMAFTAKLSPSHSAPGRKLYIWIEEARAKDEDLNLAKMTMANTAMAVTKNEIREFCGLPKSDDPEADKLPKPPEPPVTGGPPGIGSSKPKPGQPARKKRLRRKEARDFFAKGLLSGNS